MKTKHAVWKPSDLWIRDDDNLGMARRKPTGRDDLVPVSGRRVPAHESEHRVGDP